MIDKLILDELKMYGTTDSNLDKVASLFPQLLGNLICSVSVTLHPCYIFTLKFERDLYLQFTMNLGNAIRSNEFDMLDNIILDFIGTYHYYYPPYKVIIDLNPIEVKKFTELCNGFKGQTWNDILSPLIDGIYNILITATANGEKLRLGT